MNEKVRKVRLLLAVCVAAALALVVPWSSQGAVADPPPLYLVRDRAATGAAPQPGGFVAVGDAPRLVAHLLADGEQPADLEVIDGTGRVVVLESSGKVEPTGEVLDPVAVRAWLRAGFEARRSALGTNARGTTSVCTSSIQAAKDRLTLPTHRDGRELTLAETLVEADVRIAAMHDPVRQIPPFCLIRNPDTNHRAGYLHNLWHRIMGTSSTGSS